MKKGIAAKLPVAVVVCTLAVGSVSAYAATVTSDSSGAAVSGSQNQTGNPKQGRGFGWRGMDFSTLVTGGVIDQATADRIQAYMDQKKTDMQNTMNQIKNMTPDQAKTYKRNQPKTDMFADMVTQGIITQAQADAIKAAEQANEATEQANEPAGGSGTHMGFGMKWGFNTDKLVSGGVIDQATADAMNAYINQKRTDMRTQTQNMTPDQIKAYYISQPKTDMLTDMVNNGVITQAQADAIKAAMPQAGQQAGRFKSRVNTNS